MIETIIDGRGQTMTHQDSHTPGLPPGRELIGAAKQAMDRAAPAADAQSQDEKTRQRARTARRKAANRLLDQYRPAIDEYTDLLGASRFLGLKGYASLQRNKHRKRVDGTPGWPEPDRHFGRSDVWAYRTIVLHYAEAPGLGHPGRGHVPRVAPEQQPQVDRETYDLYGSVGNIAEVASQLGVSESAVDGRLRRHRARLAAAGRGGTDGTDQE